MASPRLPSSREGRPNINIGAILKGTFWALIISFVVLILLALILTFTEVPERIVPMVSLLASLIAVFVGGLQAAFKAQRNGLVHGMCTSAVYYLCVLLIGVLLYDKALSLLGFLHSVPLFLAGAFGGIMGVR